MNKMWELREGYADRKSPEDDPKFYRKGMQYRGSMSRRESDSEYENGFEEGFKCAIKQLKKLYEEMFSE